VAVRVGDCAASSDVVLVCTALCTASWCMPYGNMHVERQLRYCVLLVCERARTGREAVKGQVWQSSSAAAAVLWSTTQLHHNKAYLSSWSCRCIVHTHWPQTCDAASLVAALMRVDRACIQFNVTVHHEAPSTPHDLDAHPSRVRPTL
jgi:hypothetical protein